MNEDMEATAGEYVLGLLDREEKQAAEARLRTDLGFRAAVESFAEKMHALDLTAVPDKVPPGMWERIETAIRDLQQDPANDQFEAVPVRQPFSSRTWRWAALAAALILGIGLGYVGAELIRSPQRPVVFVVLNTEDDAPGAIFEAFADNSVRIIPLRNFEVPAGKTLQVWTLYDKAVGPVSLGTLARADATVLDGKLLPVPTENQLYEITLEPSPGSPTGKPTGPILVKGLAKRPVDSAS